MNQEIPRVPAQEFQWPKGLIDDELKTLLNSAKTSKQPLGKLVVNFIQEETEQLFYKCTGWSGYWSFWAEIGFAFERFDNLRGDAGERLKQILDQLFQRQELPYFENLTFLTEKSRDVLCVLMPLFHEQEPDFILEDFVVEEMKWVEILAQDPTGFKLIDRMLEVASEQHPVFNQEDVVGYRKAAERYKELYNLLVDAGATPDS